MSDSFAQEMVALATRLACYAGDMARDGLGKGTVERKADNSVITETDRKIQAYLLAEIAEVYPDHAVWAEETVRRPDAHADRTTARYCWVIDPLDGTRNFTHRFPCYATSIAVLDGGEPVVGVVREHNLGRLFTATRGGGTTVDSEPVRTAAWLAGADLLVGVPSSKDALTRRVVARWTATHGLIIRNLGSTAFQLSLVAAGCLAATFCKRCKIWDVAAGTLLVTEVGGWVTDPFGAPRVPFDLESDFDADTPILAAAPDVHERLIDSIRSVEDSMEHD